MKTVWNMLIPNKSFIYSEHRLTSMQKLFSVLHWRDTIISLLFFIQFFLMGVYWNLRLHHHLSYERSYLLSQSYKWDSKWSRAPNFSTLFMCVCSSVFISPTVFEHNNTYSWVWLLCVMGEFSSVDWYGAVLFISSLKQVDNSSRSTQEGERTPRAKLFVGNLFLLFIADGSNVCSKIPPINLNTRHKILIYVKFTRL